ncbi:MAG: hypothetical protein H7172_05460 [Ferruginibacter sp.]|nr:hypothetical protein [Rhodoferax sp.]
MLNCLPTRVATRVLIAASHSYTLLRCSDAVQQDGQLRLAAAVATGAAAIAMMDQCSPDVVVVDLQLQDMPALAVIRSAAGHFPQAYIADTLRWIAQGMSLAQIGARADGLHPHVLAHVKKIYRKLAAHARDESLVEVGKQDIRTVAWGYT